MKIELREKMYEGKAIRAQDLPLSGPTVASGNPALQIDLGQTLERIVDQVIDALIDPSFAKSVVN